MYGWRAKIGLITPMSENVEHAFHVYAPWGITFASTKIGKADCIDSIKAAAALYKDYGVDFIVYGNTTGDPAKSIQWNKECMDAIESASGHPAITSHMAVVEALNALGAKKIAVMAPFGEASAEAEKKFLEENGFEVTSVLGFDVNWALEKGCEIEDCDEYMLYKNALKADVTGADAFYFAGIGLTTMELVEDIETLFGIPVVTSPQAAFWSALRHCRIGGKLEKLGKLFQI